MKLTQKQKLFADEYIKSGNATQSAIQAGYSNRYAHTNANKLLQNTTIKAYINAKMAEIESHKIADAKEVLEFYTRVLREEVTEEVVVATKTDVVTVEKKPSFKDRVAVAKELMKRYPLNDPVVKAQLKKLTADTRISEARAKSLEDNGADVEDLVSGLISAIGKEDKYESS